MAAYNDKVADWYRETYPADVLGEEINERITFEMVAQVLIAGEDVYDFFGVSDSFIRERIFEELSKIYELDYDIIYRLWFDKGIPGALKEIRGEVVA